MVRSCMGTAEYCNVEMVVSVRRKWSAGYKRREENKLMKMGRRQRKIFAGIILAAVIVSAAGGAIRYAVRAGWFRDRKGFTVVNMRVNGSAAEGSVDAEGAVNAEGADNTGKQRERQIIVEDGTPRFSWQLSSEARGTSQASYRIVVAASEEKLADASEGLSAAGSGEVSAAGSEGLSAAGSGGVSAAGSEGNKAASGSEENAGSGSPGVLWDSGTVTSGQSVDIPYQGAELEPGTCYYWKVFAASTSGKTAESSTGFFETGLLAGEDGFEGAEWIAAPYAAASGKASALESETVPAGNAKASFSSGGTAPSGESQTADLYDFTIDADVWFDPVPSFQCAGFVWGYDSSDQKMIIEKLTPDPENDVVHAELSLVRKYMFEDTQTADIPGELFGDSFPRAADDDAARAAENGDRAAAAGDGTAAGDGAIAAEQNHSASPAVSFHVQITVSGETVVTRINGQEAAALPLPEKRRADGGCGFYESRGSAAYFDNYRMTEEGGAVLYEEDFSDPLENIFAPQYVEITDDGRLHHNGETLLTAGSDAASPAPVFRKIFSLQGSDGSASAQGAGEGASLKRSDVETSRQDTGEESGAGSSIKSARLYLTSAGIYEASINDQPVTYTWLNPGNAPYNIHSYYQTYDVTDLLRAGEENEIRVTLGHGWYDRACGYDGTGAVWGDHLALLGLLSITYENGEQQYIVTDSSWETAQNGPVLSNDLWQGEVYDNRITAEDLEWEKVRMARPENLERSEEESEGTIPTVSAQEDASVREIARLEPVSSWETERGTTVYDFGQDISGVCSIFAEGDRGDTVTLRHGEWINDADMSNADGPEGTLYTGNLLGAQAADRVILGGTDGGEAFTPSFTFHGFRYVEAECTGNAEILEIRAVALSSVSGREAAAGISDDTENAAVFPKMAESAGAREAAADLPEDEFIMADHSGLENSVTTGSEQMNQALSNIHWSIRNNFLSVPMDCNQRTERYGWSGDAQLISRTALYMEECGYFYRGYVQDLLDVQNPETGSVSDMAPRNFSTDLAGRGGDGGNGGWGDAIVIIPWNLYVMCGDKGILERSYGGISEWIGYLEQNQENWIRPDTGYGDHLALDDYARSCVNTAWAAHSCSLAGRIAVILGRDEDASRFAQDAEKFRAAWQAAFLDGGDTASERADAVSAEAVSGQQENRFAGLSEGSLVLGIAFHLIPDDQCQAAADVLAERIRTDGNHLETGYAGTAYILSVLSDYGHTDVVCGILSEASYPSLLYQAEQGATTIWESWRTRQPESGGTEEAGTDGAAGSSETVDEASAKTQDGNSADDTAAQRYEITGSLCHMGLGSIGEWFYEYAAGIRPDASLMVSGDSGAEADNSAGSLENTAGFRHFRILPEITEKTASLFGGSVEASYESPYGTIHSSWSYEAEEGTESDGELDVTITVPANTSATVILPAGEYREGGLSLEKAHGVTLLSGSGSDGGGGQLENSDSDGGDGQLENSDSDGGDGQLENSDSDGEQGQKESLKMELQSGTYHFQADVSLN